MSESWTRRLTVSGGTLWCATLLWFAGQFVAEAAWRTPYSLAHNFVSDLGATTCGRFPADTGPYVCSPLHALMNTSFVLWGAMWTLGGLAFAALASARSAERVAYLLIALGGVGTIVIGIVPENVDFLVHGSAALVQTLAFVAGLVILGGRALRRGRPASGALTLLVAAATLIGILATGAATSTGTFAGIGVGVWERISLWPIPVWLAVAGIGRLARPASSAPGPAVGTAATG